MLGERHGGKPRIRLLRQLTRLRGSKEGQDIIWHAARFPKRLPPINTNGTAGIRISKRAQGSTRQFRPPRPRLHGIKGSVSTRHRQNRKTGVKGKSGSVRVNVGGRRTLK